MTIQDVKTAQTTLHQAINQAYQKGAFSLDDSIEITHALSELANFINAVEQQQKDNEKKVVSISESELIEALEKSTDNPANKK